MAIPFRSSLVALFVALSAQVSSVAAPPVLADPLAAENGSVRVVPKIPVGKALVLPLLASDADGDVLDFSVTSSNPAILARVRTGCPILKIHVSYAGDPAATPTPSVAFQGDLEFQLFRDVTPATTGNIGGAAQAGFYNNLIFHRVIPGFVIQAGDPQGTGSGDPGFTSPHEFRPELIFAGRGQLAMANSQGGYRRGVDFGSGLIQLGSFDATNGSQFFATIAQPRTLDFKHTIFGQLLRGFDVLDKVSLVPRGANDRPTVPVTMTTVSLTPGTSDATLLLSATATGVANLIVTVRDASGGVATQRIQVIARRDDTNDPPFLRPIPGLLSRVGVAPSLPLRAIDLERDYLLYGIASASGNEEEGALGSAQIANTFSPKTTAGFQNLALAVAGFNDPLLALPPTTANPFATFDPYRFQIAEIGYGDRAITADAVPVEGTAATTLTDAVLAEFRDGDPAGTTGTKATVNWGDGSAVETTGGTTPKISIAPSVVTPGAFAVKGTHTFARAGVYSIEVVLDGSLGAVARTRGQGVIVDAGTPLRALGVTLQNVGSVVSGRVLATFTDSTPGVQAGDFSATIDWGDGHSAPGRVLGKGAGKFAVLGTHGYRDPETFSVFVHLARTLPAALSAVAWSQVTAAGFTGPRHLPPFSTPHLTGQISQARDSLNNGIPVISTIGAETRFALSIVAVNSGDLPSKPGNVRFYLSKDQKFNATAVADQPADIPLPVGDFTEANLPAIQAGSGLRYDLVQSVQADGSVLDLRLRSPSGQNGASYYILAHLDYTDPLADLLPIAKDVTYGRINGIAVNKLSLSLTESPGNSHAQNFSVVLKGRPLADVRIPLALSDTAQITPDKSILTFTRQNWNVPQTVTLTASDDTLQEGTTTTTITVGPSESTDASWNDMSGGTVRVLVLDNDPA